MKAVLVVLLAVLATAMAQTSLVNTCSYQTNTYDCQASSNSVQCCLWCQAAQNSDVGTCVSGNVDPTSGQSINCKPNAQCAFFQGTCTQSSNCPGVTPYIAGTWYYPAQCNSIGGQLNINFVNQGLGTFTFNSTGSQALRLPQYSGVVDQNGNIIMTAPPANCVNGNCPTCTVPPRLASCLSTAPTRATAS